jgi:hypothetical protein
MTEATEKLTLSTGITVGIRRISPYTFDALRRAFPAPEPPTQPMDYGDGDLRQEPNPAHPAHLARLEQHQALLNEKSQQLMLSMGVELDLDEAALGLLSVLRTGLKAIGVEIDADNHMAYLKHVAIKTGEDLTRIANAITSKSQPTEEAVQDHLETFSGDGAGAGSL